jgi:hypothetical protein
MAHEQDRNNETLQSNAWTYIWDCKIKNWAGINEPAVSLKTEILTHADSCEASETFYNCLVA